jgi:ribonuclease T2
MQRAARVATLPPAPAVAIPLALAIHLALAASPARAEVDHYVLALSWSPTFCATEGRDEPLQCAPDRDLGFVVHGLWPNTATDAPAYCRQRGPNPSRQDIERVLDVMPSRSLARHQWRKHGTCSGLSPAAYFDTIRRARAAVAIPPALDVPTRAIELRPAVLSEAFRRVNPGLPEGGIYIRCRSGDLVDVRICLSPDLRFQVCPRAPEDACRARMIDVPPPE